MDYDDLKSEIRAAALGVEDLASRVDDGSPGSAQELEIDASLARQELDELDRKLDVLRDDHADSEQAPTLDEPDFDELDREIESARDQLGDVERAIDDIPELSDVEELEAPGAEVDAGRDTVEPGPSFER